MRGYKSLHLCLLFAWVRDKFKLYHLSQPTHKLLTYIQLWCCLFLGGTMGKKKCNDAGVCIQNSNQLCVTSRLFCLSLNCTTSKGNIWDTLKCSCCLLPLRCWIITDEEKHLIHNLSYTTLKLYGLKDSPVTSDWFVMVMQHSRLKHQFNPSWTVEDVFLAHLSLQLTDEKQTKECACFSPSSCNPN